MKCKRLFGNFIDKLFHHLSQGMDLTIFTYYTHIFTQSSDNLAV
ncbi:hypothetical protein AO382_0508 [Moraxella catarrhalis]|uniref:Uncharacterized protein n=1 Tax=Moraxella catarrhalis TaxID=480 RepID=A0A7Z0V0H7_MORCA|nr:hypothetical protein AO382_0508 [Moraxella catarrhalis]